MPINKAAYPLDWPAISRRIRERDQHCCKWCGMPNGAYVYYDHGETIVLAADDRAEAEQAAPIGVKVSRVVLTVAHLDHNSAHNDDANLAALCQRDHLRHDARQHATNAAATRR